MKLLKHHPRWPWQHHGRSSQMLTDDHCQSGAQGGCARCAWPWTSCKADVQVMRGYLKGFPIENEAPVIFKDSWQWIDRNICGFKEYSGGINLHSSSSIILNTIDCAVFGPRILAGMRSSSWIESCAFLRFFLYQILRGMKYVHSAQASFLGTSQWHNCDAFNSWGHHFVAGYSYFSPKFWDIECCWMQCLLQISP